MRESDGKEILLMTDDAATVLERYLKAQREKDLDALCSCWDENVEVVHPMRPDRNWHGLDTYRRQWNRIWSEVPNSRFELVSTAVSAYRIYLEALTESLDGTMVPHMNVLEVENGKIRRGRVYTDKPRHDGLSIEDFTVGLYETS
jgi:ketosteroid isomerase-like protein